MKILFCTNVYDPPVNGAAKMARMLEGLNKTGTGIEFRVLTEDVRESSGYIYKLPLCIPGIFRPLGQFIRIWAYYRNALKIRNEFPFDVIVFNNAIHGLLCARKMKEPVLGMVNDDNLVLKKQPFLKNAFFRPLERQAFFKLHKILVCSRYLYQTLQNYYKFPTDKAYLMYFSVDLQEEPVFDRSFENPVRILFIKEDYYRGGLDLLARALQRINKKFRVTVAGPPEKEKQKVLNYFENASNVELKFVGPSSEQEIWHAYRNADIFCMPSRREALGMAHMEAMAMGVPVVTSDAGGIPEVTGKGTSAWVARREHVVDLTFKIQLCLDSPEVRKEKCRRGYQRIKKYFSSNRMLEEFVKIVKETVSSSLF